MGGAFAQNSHPEFKIQNYAVIEKQRYRIAEYTVVFFTRFFTSDHGNLYSIIERGYSVKLSLRNVW